MHREFGIGSVLDLSHSLRNRGRPVHGSPVEAPDGAFRLLFNLVDGIGYRYSHFAHFFFSSFSSHRNGLDIDAANDIVVFDCEVDDFSDVLVVDSLCVSDYQND